MPISSEAFAPFKFFQVFYLRVSLDSQPSSSCPLPVGIFPSKRKTRFDNAFAFFESSHLSFSLARGEVQA